MSGLEHLREDEIAWLASLKRRCAACGHLELLHNEHCCSFCLIAGCPCSFGYIPDEEDRTCGNNEYHNQDPR